LTAQFYSNLDKNGIISLTIERIKMKKALLILMTLTALILSACSTPSPDAGRNSYTNISVETLKTMLDERPDSFLLVNTHIPFEGNIPQTDVSIAYNEILANLDQLPQDKDAEIVLYCRSDNMSHAAAADLVQAGYTNIINVTGGFRAWEAAGYPLEMAP
jgi:rhodanese-related sulfurtransferase